MRQTKKTKSATLAVLGAGAWGTALANMAADLQRQGLALVA